MLRDEIKIASRALLPGRTNPRNCLEITLVFNGCDPAFLQPCYDRPGVGLSLSRKPCRVWLSTSNPHIPAAVDKLSATTIAKGNGHYRFTFQANNGEGRARNSRI
jgi:hypothetical protein